MFAKQGQAIANDKNRRNKVRQKEIEFVRKRKLYMLLGGRSGRISLVQDPDTGESIQVIDDDSGKPALELIYEFFKDPQSSLSAYLWSLMLSISSSFRIIQLSMLTLDGPHFYEGRHHMSMYPYLPSESQHAAIFLGLCLPLLFDTFIRSLFVFTIFLDKETELYRALISDTLFWSLNIMGILGSIPICIQLSVSDNYSEFYLQGFREELRVLLRLMSLCIGCNIFRHMMHFHVIKTVSLALTGSAKHLVLPGLFFLTFNTTFGILYYFLEPCYDTYNCHWHDLFEATVFIIVTMTTVGYGNQYPQNFTMKCLAVVVMLFGSLYLSMPLALIGNEYVDVVARLEREKKEEVAKVEEKLSEIHAVDRTYKMELHDIVNLTSKETPLTSEGDDNTIQSMEMVVLMNKCVELSSMLDKEVTKKGNLTPVILMAFSELKAVTPVILNVIQVTSLALGTAWKRGVEKAEKIYKYKLEHGLVDESSSSSSDDSDSDSLTSSDDEKGAVQVGSRAFPGLRRMRHGRNGVKGARTRKSVHADADIMNDSTLKVSDMLLQRNTKASRDRASSSSSSSDSSSGSEGEISEGSKGGKGTEGAKRGRKDSTSSSDSSTDDEHNIGVSDPFSESDTTGEQNEFTKMMQSMHKNLHSGKPLDIHNRDTKVRKPSAFSVESLREFVSTAGDRLMAAYYKVTGTRPSRESKLKKKKKDVQQNQWEERLAEALENPRSLNNRLWLMLEVPHSSRQAMFLRSFLTTVAISSLLILYVESMTYFNSLGETTVTCGDVLREYCVDKNSASDPGCFVQSPFGCTTVRLKFPQSKYLTKSRLSELKDDDCYATYSGSAYYSAATDTFSDSVMYNYTAATNSSMIMQFSEPLNECFGEGYNFGTTEMEDEFETYAYRPDTLVTNTNITCLASTDGTPLYPDKVGFLSQTDLDFKYRHVEGTVTRDDKHLRSAICSRPECALGPPGLDFQTFIVFVEVFTSFIFILELLVRLYLESSMWNIVTNKLYYIDFMNLLPFFMTIGTYSNLNPGSTIMDVDFRILSSAPGPFIVILLRGSKLARLYRLMDSFQASRLLVVTAKKVSRQIFAMITMFTLSLFCFAVLFYELERGEICYVGDDNCDVPSDLDGVVHVGDRILVDKYGDASQFSTVLDTFWFCFVCATTVGYGDKIPVTNMGWLLNLALMVFGAAYLVFPLTAASSTFYNVYSRYLMNKESSVEEEDELGANILLDIFSDERYDIEERAEVQRVVDWLKRLGKKQSDLTDDIYSNHHSPHHYNLKKQRDDYLREREAEQEKSKKKKGYNEERKDAADLSGSEEEDEDEEEELLDEDELREKEEREEEERQRKIEEHEAKMRRLNTSSLALRIKDVATEVIAEFTRAKAVIENVATFEVKRRQSMAKIARFVTENEED